MFARLTKARHDRGLVKTSPKHKFTLLVTLIVLALLAVFLVVTRQSTLVSLELDRKAVNLGDFLTVKVRWSVKAVGSEVLVNLSIRNLFSKRVIQTFSFKGGLTGEKELKIKISEENYEIGVYGITAVVLTPTEPSSKPLASAEKHFSVIWGLLSLEVSPLNASVAKNQSLTFTVKVLNAVTGNPVERCLVFLNATGGRFNSSMLITNRSGVVQVVWKAPPVTGKFKISVEAVKPCFRSTKKTVEVLVT